MAKLQPGLPHAADEAESDDHSHREIVRVVHEPQRPYPRSLRPFILAGGFDKASAQQALAYDLADLIAFGRPFIANPDLVERMRADKPLSAPDPATFYTPGAKGYTDYPAASD